MATLSMARGAQSLLASWLLVLTWAHPGYAGCGHLNELLTAAEYRFSYGYDPSPAIVARLERAISLVRPEMLADLIDPAQDPDGYAKLSRLIAGLNAASQQAGQSAVELSEGLRSDLIAGRSRLEAACRASEGASGDGGNPVVPLAQRIQEMGQRVASAFGLRAAQGDAAGEPFQMRQLARFFLLVFGLLLSALLLNYALVALRVIRRNRRHCDIPADLTCLFQTVPGHLSVLGARGCVFEPCYPSGLDGLTSIDPGFYCTVEIAGTPVSAKTMLSVTETCSLLFQTELTPDEMQGFFAASRSRTRYDFSVATIGQGGRREFGLLGLLGISRASAGRQDRKAPPLGSGPDEAGPEP